MALFVDGPGPKKVKPINDGGQKSQKLAESKAKRSCALPRINNIKNEESTTEKSNASKSSQQVNTEIENGYQCVDIKDDGDDSINITNSTIRTETPADKLKEQLEARKEEIKSLTKEELESRKKEAERKEEEAKTSKELFLARYEHKLILERKVEEDKADVEALETQYEEAKQKEQEAKDKLLEAQSPMEQAKAQLKAINTTAMRVKVERELNSAKDKLAQSQKELDKLGPLVHGSSPLVGWLRPLSDEAEKKLYSELSWYSQNAKKYDPSEMLKQTSKALDEAEDIKAKAKEEYSKIQEKLPDDGIKPGDIVVFGDDWLPKSGK